MSHDSSKDESGSEERDHWVEVFKDMEWKGGKGTEEEVDGESEGTNGREETTEGEEKGKEDEGSVDVGVVSEMEEDGTENRIRWKGSRSEEVIQREDGTEEEGEGETEDLEIVEETEIEEVEMREWNRWLRDIIAGRGDKGETTGNSDEENVKTKKARRIARKTKEVITQAKGKLFYSPGVAADLFIVGWRFWFLMLRTLETALLVSPRSSPYALDLLCSLKHLSIPSRNEIHKRIKDNYMFFSGEYFWVLRSLVCLSVFRFVSPFRVMSAVTFISLCGFLPIDDRSFGQYQISKDFQRVVLVIIAIFLTGAIYLVFWCVLMVTPFILLHLVFHNPGSSNGPVFGNLCS